MSLSAALSVAVGGLQATQVKLSVAAANIANADTEGYTRKIATQTTVVTGGYVAGVAIAGISGQVDRNLLRALVEAGSEYGAAGIADDYAQSLADVLGTVASDDGTSLADGIANLVASIESLAQTPESSSLKNAVVSDLDSLVGLLRDSSAAVQDLRADADADIGAAVEAINTSLQAIERLNEAIAQAVGSGQSTADLEDQRNSELHKIAQKIDVSYYLTSDGQLRLFTGSGEVLVDSQAHWLVYETVGTVTAATAYSEDPPSGFSAITLNGKDVTGSIASGELAALINERDVALPAVQAELDNLAAALSTAVNTVHNQGTSIPASNSLTGSRSVAASDVLSATGSFRIATVDSDGTVVAAADIDLSTLATVQDLADALNAVSGITAAIDADGHLTVGADDSSLGVAINEMDSAVGSGDQGLSNYFGLNDLLTGSSADTIAVRADIAVQPDLLAVGKLDDGDLAVGDAGIAAGDADVAATLHNVLDGNWSFDAAGGLGAATCNMADYAARIVSTAATVAETKATDLSVEEATYDSLQASYSSATGVNVDEETARLTELETAYAAIAKILEAIQEMYDSLLAAVG